MAKRRANGDVCERCQWHMKRAKRSGSNKEYREVNNDRYDYVATGEGVKYGSVLTFPEVPTAPQCRAS